MHCTITCTFYRDTIIFSSLQHGKNKNNESKLMKQPIYFFLSQLSVKKYAFKTTARCVTLTHRNLYSLFKKVNNKLVGATSTQGDRSKNKNKFVLHCRIAVRSALDIREMLFSDFAWIKHALSMQS